MKLDRSKYKYIESEIRAYPTTLKEYNHRRQEILYDRTGEPQEGGKGNAVSRPTERYALQLVEDRRLGRLRVKVDAIETVMQECSEKHRQFIQLYFHDKPQTKTFDGIAYELDVSRRTLFRIRDEIVYSVAKKMGEY